MNEGFYSKLVGVTYSNPDGSSRQKIIRSCSQTEKLQLVREPDSPYDTNSIVAVRSSGEQVGHLDARTAAQLAPDLDSGAKWFCMITEITGGGPGKPTRGVNIYLSNIDLKIIPEETSPIQHASLYEEKTIPQQALSGAKLALYIIIGAIFMLWLIGKLFAS